MLTYEKEGSYHWSDTVRQVQEMLNQVCPRKVTTAFGLEGKYRYSIIGEDGEMGKETTNAIHYLKHEFVKATNSFIMHVNAFSNDRVLYKRLTNEYPIMKSEDMIVDWKLLRGQTLAIGAGQDVTANGRDGLVEIYSNVVENFINQMIEEGDAYVNYNGHNWYGRVNESGVYAQLHDADGQLTTNISCSNETTGVSYSYGSIDSIAQFGSKLDSQQGVTNWSGYTTHKVGLFKDEEHYWVTGNNPPGGYSYGLLGPLEWAGIDCRGFVQRICKTPHYGNGAKMIPDRIIPDLTGDFDNDITVWNWTLNGDNSGHYNTGNAYQIDNTRLSYVHQGDLIESHGHIVVIYDEPADNNDIDLSVINAYGFFVDNIYSTTRKDFSRKTIVMPYYLWVRQFKNIHNAVPSSTYRYNINLTVKYGRFTLWVR